MRINAKIQNEIKESYRAGAKSEDLARFYGYTVQEIEKVIFPHGKQPRELAIVIHRKKPSEEVRKQKQQEVLPNRPVEAEKKKDEKWIAAGKKAWETRQRRLAAAASGIPPMDQPVVENLSTIRQEDRDKALKLIEESIEYIQVGLDSIREALELLKR